MSFSVQIGELASQVRQHLPHVDVGDLEATRRSLVSPFVGALGYDVRDPSDVSTGVSPHGDSPDGRGADFALLQNGLPAVLLFCVPAGTSLSGERKSELARCFGGCQARVGVLTDGVEYRIFFDLESRGEMDAQPLFRFDLLGYDDRDVTLLSRLRKSAFDPDQLATLAFQDKYQSALRDHLETQLEGPDDLFLQYLAYRVYDGEITQGVRDQLREAAQEVLRDLARGASSEAPSRQRGDGSALSGEAADQEAPGGPEMPGGEGPDGPAEKTEASSGSGGRGSSSEKRVVSDRGAQKQSSPPQDLPASGEAPPRDGGSARGGDDSRDRTVPEKSPPSPENTSRENGQEEYAQEEYTYVAPGLKDGGASSQEAPSQGMPLRDPPSPDALSVSEERPRHEGNGSSSGQKSRLNGPEPSEPEPDGSDPDEAGPGPSGQGAEAAPAGQETAGHGGKASEASEEAAFEMPLQQVQTSSKETSSGETSPEETSPEETSLEETSREGEASSERQDSSKEQAPSEEGAEGPGQSKMQPPARQQSSEQLADALSKKVNSKIGG